MNTQPDHSAVNANGPTVVQICRTAKVKALEPMTSTAAPSRVEVLEYSKNQAMLRVGRYLPAGTVVQLHMDGEFRLWKVFCCIRGANSYRVGIELIEAM
jgi:hypothetical protein